MLALRQLDDLVAKPLVTWLEAQKMDFRLLMLSDHKTLMSTRGHDGDPVPWMLYDSRKPEGMGLPYTEANGLKGPFLPNGVALMDMLFEK